jgi:phage gpG-like protein
VIDIEVKTRLDVQEILRRSKRGQINSLGRASALVRTIASRSIRKKKKASSPGTPPNTQKKALKKGIVFAVEKGKDRSVIGPSHDFVGASGMAHEFGGRYGKERYPKRPFMHPALMKAAPQLPAHWAGILK